VNDCTTGNDFCRPGQKVFARSIDIEYRGVEQIVCNGGSLWILGYKTENGKSAPFVCRNGGSLEILGGYSNATSMPKTLDASSRYFPTIIRTCRHLLREPAHLAQGIEEIRDGQTYTAMGTDLTPRGDGFRQMYVVPLYVGRGRGRNRF